MGKTKIAEANATTKVKIGDDTFSIIELIDYKSASDFLINRYNNTIRQYDTAKALSDKQQDKIEQEVSKQVEASMSNKSNSSKELTDTLTTTYTSLWGAEIVGVDINDIRNKLLKDKLDNWQISFEENIETFKRNNFECDKSKDFILEGYEIHNIINQYICDKYNIVYLDYRIAHKSNDRNKFEIKIN